MKQDVLNLVKGLFSRSLSLCCVHHNSNLDKRMKAKLSLNLLRVSYFSMAAILCSPAYGEDNREEQNHAVSTYSKVADEMNQLLQENIYDPKVLLSPAYKSIKTQIQLLADQSLSESAYIKAFNLLWETGPFSHVNLAPSAQTTEQMADYFDQMNVGGNGASLRFQDKTAVLTVNTMMGQDTIKQIEEAYHDIAQVNPENLIIDLRNNQGGAFAILPLVQHLLDESLDAGVFLSNNYVHAQNESPSTQEINQLSPWRGWSLRSFWHDVEINGVTRVQFEPQAPKFKGPVYVLVSNKTASAAELAAEAMRASGRAILIGENTAGAMLSQKPYKLSNGLMLFLPFADYVSRHSGRIEGKGLQADIETKSDLALDKAFELIQLAGNQGV